MAEKYHAPQLCNYYCSNECEIGKQYVPEVKVKDIANIVLAMLSSLNSAKKRQERLIEITSDGRIAADEVEDFVLIQEELEKISITGEALQLWAETKLASGDIDIDAYNAAKKHIGQDTLWILQKRSVAVTERFCNYCGKGICFFCSPCHG